jgi:dihydrofolate reductase
MTRVAMIAAVASNGVIGSDQSIPWYIPSDFAWFKRTTMGKPLVMGRKQFETVGKPLPGRTNIVVTSRSGYAPDGVVVVDSPEAALDRARAIADEAGVDEVMVIGGGEIYRQLLGYADRLYITHVDIAPEGDVRFPDIDPAEWVVIEEPPIAPDARDEAAYRVKVYERRKPGAH